MNNIGDLIEAVATSASVPKKTAKSVIDALLDEVVTTISRGEEVQISGFGKFQSKRHAARQARNPRTGETVKIAARNVVSFRPAKAFKDAI